MSRTKDLNDWLVKTGLQDLETDLHFVLERYYSVNELFDDGIHEDVTNEIIELLRTYWQELG